MVAKFHKLNEKIDVDYPVGHYISKAYNYIEFASKIFLYENKDHEITINLWCMGSSGAILASLFSERMKQKQIKCRICHVKKKGERSHSNYFPSISTKDINIIIDDFITTGDTVNTIYKKFTDNNPRLEIDWLIVCRTVYQSTLKFIPKHLICSKYEQDF